MALVDRHSPSDRLFAKATSTTKCRQSANNDPNVGELNWGNFALDLRAKLELICNLISESNERLETNVSTGSGLAKSAASGLN